ncbi:MAG: response regulator, partial [Verrucomicrobiota bacterium]|nr:response regulator [Verrucomicrobiota bacterium]
LVIDDTELLLLFAEEILSTAIPELKIVTASSGSEGVARALALKPDAVLLDYSLPDITGDEVCRQLLEEQVTTGIPVTMMSGHVPEMNATAERYENVVATIAKPFLSHALVSLVREVLDGERPRMPRARIAVPASEPSPLVLETPLAEPEAAAPVPPDREVEHDQAVDDISEAPAPIRISDTPPHAPSEPQNSPVEEAGRAPKILATAIESPVEPRERCVAPSVASVAVQEARREPPPSPPTHEHREPFTPHLSAPIERLPPSSSTHASLYAAPALAAVAIPSAKSNAVVLAVPLEVLAMQFSPTLQMAAIRARPCSPTVALHVHPQALHGFALPEAGFELGGVLLNARGHIETVRLTPTRLPLPRQAAAEPLRVSDVAILPAKGGETMELIPTAISPMTMQLFASFELAGVELSATFGVASLVLQSRGAEIRVTLQPGGPTTGATFKTAQVLLDREARIAEILLDATA